MRRGKRRLTEAEPASTPPAKQTAEAAAVDNFDDEDSDDGWVLTELAQIEAKTASLRRQYNNARQTTPERSPKRPCVVAAPSGEELPVPSGSGRCGASDEATARPQGGPLRQ